MRHRIRVAALLLNELNEILLVQHVHPVTNFEWWVPPGGGMESIDESIFSCAMRETFEESGIFNIDFPFGREHIQVSTMIIFIGETSQDPKISPNPVTGVFEHEDANWITFDEMEEGCMTFLLPAIKWARRKLEEQEN